MCLDGHNFEGFVAFPLLTVRLEAFFCFQKNVLPLQCIISTLFVYNGLLLIFGLIRFKEFFHRCEAALKQNGASGFRVPGAPTLLAEMLFK